MSVRIVDRLFNFLTGRAAVRERSLGRGVEYLRILLNEGGLADPSRVSDKSCTALVHEACHRAAAADPDNIARYGRYHEELAAIATLVLQCINGGQCADPRIKSILEFNSEPTNQPKHSEGQPTKN